MVGVALLERSGDLDRMQRKENYFGKHDRNCSPTEEAASNDHAHDEVSLGTFKVGDIEIEAAQGHGMVAAGTEGPRPQAPLQGRWCHGGPRLDRH